jgi:hypothetical protein
VDVHRPRGPFSSFRDFILEIATIVIGVLIALSFEGLREWEHNRTLADQTRDTIVRELTGNKKSLDADIGSAPGRKQQVAQALQFTNEVLQTGKTTLHSISLNFVWGDLRRSSWRRGLNQYRNSSVTAEQAPRSAGQKRSFGIRLSRTCDTPDPASVKVSAFADTPRIAE